MDSDATHGSTEGLGAFRLLFGLSSGLRLQLEQSRPTGIEQFQQAELVGGNVSQEDGAFSKLSAKISISLSHNMTSNSQLDAGLEIVCFYANESGGRYCEIKDALTGKTVGHKVFAKE